MIAHKNQHQPQQKIKITSSKKIKQKTISHPKIKKIQIIQTNIPIVKHQSLFDITVFYISNSPKIKSTANISSKPHTLLYFQSNKA